MTGQPMFTLDGKVAIVIGAASGIGEAAALGCARHGAEVHCLDVNEAGARAVAIRARQHNAASEARSLDIRDVSAVDAALDDIVATRGRVDVAICTPSVNVRKPLLDYTPEEFDRVVSLNLRGTFNVLRAAGRHMVARGSGSIVLCASIRSQVVEPGQSVYAATKAGIVQLARTAAAEFGPAGVRVNALAPGIVETPLTAPIKASREWYDAYASKSVLNRWAAAEEMAGPILFLASDAASYVTGAVLFADGGWTAADGRFQPPGI